ncbi:hypothetical protein BDF20DRAFT_811983, partial [Mycotypha africana]|uniref:uncharacterized protein n=1 Tax=Mycotypha africana TaxID=64632 RepID=UPI002301DF5A
NDLKDDYEELIQPILDAHPYIFVRAEKNDPYSFDEFLRVSSLISSRAFEVDAYHENALVPFADLFNHRSEGEHVHFETEYGVCDACGLMYCEHRYFDFMEEGAESKDNAPSNEEDEDEWEDEEDDAESMELDTELPDLEKMEEEGINFYDSDDGSDEEDEDTCDMVLDRDIKKGEEVFNTYGDHPNIALLSKYGFCYDDNKNDYLSIDENTIAECCIGLHTEALKETMPNASEDELQKKAVELVRPRWEFFMNNEHILCPDPNAEDIQDDFEDEDHHDHTHCDHDHDHENGHVHGENCDPSHDDDHTDGEEEEDEEHAVERSPPYYINWEGLFEDKVMCCLHIMFVNNETFADFVENTDNAVKYFEDLSNSQGQAKTKALIQVKSSVYKACRALAEIRKLEYEENGEWKSVKEETKERDELMYPTDNVTKYYALTCRIGEKKIIEKCIAYYSKMVKEWSGNGPTTNKNKKKPAKKNKKARY